MSDRKTTMKLRRLDAPAPGLEPWQEPDDEIGPAGRMFDRVVRVTAIVATAVLGWCVVGLLGWSVAELVQVLR